MTRSLLQFGRSEVADAARTIALVPAAILIHELAHLAVALLIGVPNARLHFAGFTHGPAPWLAPWQVAAITLAGPISTLGLAVGSLVLFSRTHRSWLVALGIAACTRLFVLLPFALAAVRRRLTGVEPRPTTIDEERGVQLLALPGDLTLVAVTAVLTAVLFLLWRQCSPHAYRGFVVGAVFGWVTWMEVLGPTILP